MEEDNYVIKVSLRLTNATGDDVVSTGLAIVVSSV